MNLKIYRTNPSLILYFMLILSLPSFFVRYEYFRGSITLIIFWAIGLFSIFVMLQKGKAANVIGLLEVFIFIYILWFFCIYMVHMNDSAIIPMLKTIMYFFLYLLLKNFIMMNKASNIEICTYHGIVCGIVLFFIIPVYSLYIDGTLFKIFDKITYHHLTFRIYSSINNLLGGNDKFLSKDMMRSALGEVFAFYTIFLMIFFMKNKELFSIKYIPFAIIGVIICFSRRSLLSTAISSIIIPLREGDKIITKALLFIFLMFLLYILVFVFAFETRLVDLSDTNNIRKLMIISAMNGISEYPIFGHGYGIKIFNDYYVHNFVFSSGYSLGIFGLFISICIFTLVMYYYIKGMISKTNNGYSYLLIIPVLGMLVGSTLEGMYTITSWIIFALYASTYQVHKIRYIAL